MESKQSPRFGQINQPTKLHPLQHQPVQAQHQNPSSDPTRKSKRILCGLGIAEIFIGVSSIAFAIAATVDGSNRRRYYKIGDRFFSFRFDPSDKCSDARYWSLTSQGIWCGSLTLIVGILGIVLANKTSRRLYVANMITAIITTCAVVAGIVLSGLTAAFSESCAGLLVGMQVVIALLCFAAMVIIISHVAFCSCNRVQLQEAPQKSQQSYYEQPQEAHYDNHHMQEPDDKTQPAATHLPTTVEPHQQILPMYETPLDCQEEDQAGVVIYDEIL